MSGNPVDCAFLSRTTGAQRCLNVRHAVLSIVTGYICDALPITNRQYGRLQICATPFGFKIRHRTYGADRQEEARGMLHLLHGNAACSWVLTSLVPCLAFLGVAARRCHGWTSRWSLAQKPVCSGNPVSVAESRGGMTALLRAPFRSRARRCGLSRLNFRLPRQRSKSPIGAFHGRLLRNQRSCRFPPPADDEHV